MFFYFLYFFLHFFFLLFWLRIVPEYYFLAQGFANLHGKLGPKNNIPEVFLTRKAKKKKKNMNHGSPLFPTIYQNVRLKSIFCRFILTLL